MRKGLVVTILGLLVVFLMHSFPAEASVRKLPAFRLYTLRGEEIPFAPPHRRFFFSSTLSAFPALSSSPNSMNARRTSGEKFYFTRYACDAISGMPSVLKTLWEENTPFTSLIPSFPHSLGSGKPLRFFW